MPSIASRNTPSRSTQMSWVFSRPSRCTLKKKREVGLNSCRRLRMNMPFVQRYVLLPRENFRREPANFRIDQRLASANGDDGRAALFDSGHALLDRHYFVDRGFIFANA